MSLPPLPLAYEVTAREGEHEGSRHVYLVDANGRKVACIWGKPDEKIALTTMIINAAAKLAPATESP